MSGDREQGTTGNREQVSGNREWFSSQYTAHRPQLLDKVTQVACKIKESKNGAFALKLVHSSFFIT